jgi:hypothetical protein
LLFAGSGQHIVRDEDVPGFFPLVGTRSKTFMIQGDLWENGKRRTIRVKIGEVGKIATREARAKAKVLLGPIADGVENLSEDGVNMLTCAKSAAPFGGAVFMT